MLGKVILMKKFVEVVAGFWPHLSLILWLNNHDLVRVSVQVLSNHLYLWKEKKYNFKICSQYSGFTYIFFQPTLLVVYVVCEWLPTHFFSIQTLKRYSSLHLRHSSKKCVFYVQDKFNLMYLHLKYYSIYPYIKLGPNWGGS